MKEIAEMIGSVNQIDNAEIQKTEENTLYFLNIKIS